MICLLLNIELSYVTRFGAIQRVSLIRNSPPSGQPSNGFFEVPIEKPASSGKVVNIELTIAQVHASSNEKWIQKPTYCCLNWA